MYALIDCNNFYASCERLFRPDLINRPIVVLSNNDGCVIARSNEAKDLGVAMGEPFFKIKALSKQHGIQVFSSNYTLYGDMSQRVMTVIETAWPEVEIYSIDEAFLDLSDMPVSMYEPFCKDLQKKILKFTGIPTSIGIGETKTLAKIANHLCKKVFKIPVFNICGQHQWLADIKVGDVWGVGRQWQKKLMAKGICTAKDLAKTHAPLIKKQFNVMLMRTAMELQGIVCLELEVAQAKQSILSSKSFSEMQTDVDCLQQAISSHCARACEKARSQQLVAQRLHVFIRSNPYRSDLPQYGNSIECRLVTPTSDTCIITALAKACVQQIFKANIHYKKVGVMLGDLIDKNQLQLDLFHQPDEAMLQKQDRLMGVLDTINTRFGSHTIQLAAQGLIRPWESRSQMRSPCYTTRWSDLPVVHNRT